MKSKLLIFTLILSALVCLSACNGKEAEQTETETGAQIEQTQNNEQTESQSKTEVKKANLQLTKEKKPLYQVV